MRFETIFACQYLVWRLDYVDAVRTIKDDGDLIQVSLHNGKNLMLLLIERGMSLDEIRYHYEANTKAGIHSLMMPWVDMFLPQDGQETELNAWMQALMALHGGKIYGYEVAGRDAFFFPIEFLGQGKKRRVRFGNIVNYAALGGKKVSTLNPYMAGEWLVAGFESKGQSYRGTSSTIASRHPLQSFYDILGLPIDSDLESVKRAYRALARLYHPDVNTSEEADVRMKRINLAYSKITSYLEE